MNLRVLNRDPDPGRVTGRVGQLRPRIEEALLAEQELAFVIEFEASLLKRDEDPWGKSLDAAEDSTALFVRLRELFFPRSLVAAHA